MYHKNICYGMIVWASLVCFGPSQRTLAQSQSATTQPMPTTADEIIADQPEATSDEADKPKTADEVIEAIKNPFPWWKWGGDVRIREGYIGNGITLNKKDPGHEIHWQRFRTRWWNTFTPVENFELNLRIAWEGRHFDRPTARDNWAPESVLFDRLNVKLKNFCDLPLTIQAGRQELMFGDNWLVLDGTPLDGSTTAYFDAIRLTTELESIDTTLDLVYLEIDAEADNWFKPISQQDNLVTEQDETGVIAWLTNRSLPKTQLEGYFIYKKSRPDLPAGDVSEIYTFGTRAVHHFTERLTFRGDVAVQAGHKNESTLCALGSNNRLSYEFKDKWNTRIDLDYEYLSGDDPDTSANEGFDILWGRWPRYSELFIYPFIPETGVGDYTNLHRVGPGWAAHPFQKLELSSSYNLLFAEQNTLRDRVGFSRSGCFRGQLLRAILRYKFNKHMIGHLLSEFFFPGDYYDNAHNDVASFLRAEMMFNF